MASEKSSPLALARSSSDNERPRIRRMIPLVGLALLGHQVYSYVGHHVFNSPGCPSTNVNSSSSISWWTCPDVPTTQCAYLNVPTDYANPQENDTVSIFLRKVPATAPPKDYLGSILLNPGGPGGSGGGYAAILGPYLLPIVDGRYDIIGFDPRGINMTLPSLDCYETEAQGRHALYKQTLLGTLYDAGGPSTLPSETREALERVYAQKLDALFTAAHLACQTRGNKRMLESLSVGLVVQDMEQIVLALGEDGLNYWGFSFGTVLGSTFAAMRPHLVKRMVLDGVSNAESYHKDIYQWGLDGMSDTHKSLSGFLDSCAQAGPNRCAFAQPHDGKPATPSVLRARLEGLYDRLRNEPMPVPTSETGPGILTASDARLVVYRGLHSPQSWPSLAEDLAAADGGNPRALYDGAYAEFAELLPENGEKNVFNRYMEKFFPPIPAAAITCNDAETAGSKTLDEYLDYIRQMAQLSPTGENWALLAGACRTWKPKAIQRYGGPWSVAEGLNKTRFPVLFASLDADTVTPLPAAQHMANAFGNESATLLIQEGFGHTTTASSSLCALNAFRDYFLNGQVPSHGTTCKPEAGRIFPGNDLESIRNLSAKDQELWKVLERLSDTPEKFYRPT